MNDKIKEKIREALSSILPVASIILILSFTVAPLPSSVTTLFLIGTVLLMLGMGLFTLGAEISMSLIGERVGANIAKNRNFLIIVLVLFVLGTIITISEPDLKVLATQISSIPENVTVIAVAVGVGIFLAIGFLRIIFKIDISYVFLILYGLVFLIAAFVPRNFWAIAFDSGGVTTGPMTVPFLIALGVGASSICADKDSDSDSFGLVALCSVGPIITMLILGLFYDITDVAAPTYSINSFATSNEIGMYIVSELPNYAKDVGVALLPIIIFFGIYQAVALHLPKNEVKKILVGVIYTYIGLVMFLLGANVGFLPAGYLIGSKIASLSYNWIIIPIGMVIGYFIVIAEPAVNILVKQISDITDGGIPEKAMKFNLSISISLALLLAMVRLLTRCIDNVFPCTSVILLQFYSLLLHLKYLHQLPLILAVLRLVQLLPHS